MEQSGPQAAMLLFMDVCIHSQSWLSKIKSYGISKFIKAGFERWNRQERPAGRRPEESEAAAAAVQSFQKSDPFFFGDGNQSGEQEKAITPGIEWMV